MMVGLGGGALASGYCFTLAAFEVGGASVKQERDYGSDLDSFFTT